jgi:hypothetical protein
VQHDAASLAERIGRAGIKGHHFGSPDIAKGFAARDAGGTRISWKLWDGSIAPVRP